MAKNPKKGKSPAQPDSVETQDTRQPSLLLSTEETAPDSRKQSNPLADTIPERKKRTSFPIVGVGASAGGLAAFEAFFTHMPADTESGIAFVLVQHLDPDHKSILTNLIGRYTRMQVYEVEDGVTIQPNSTYIIPPNKDMAILNGRLHLMDPTIRHGVRLPIDSFFRSLAQDQGEKAVCILLSGAGTDGTLGLRAIKEAGGMVMVQSPETAKYDSMPRSAISTGLADYVLPPEAMPQQLITYVSYTIKPKRGKAAAPEISSWLQKIFILMRAQTRHDFSLYKQSTMRRRIERRMAVHQISQIEQYVRYLRENPIEVETLFRELLIGVTGFFRDPEAYAALETKIIPQLFASSQPDNPLRVWVAGCATGEEAYSLAILLQEFAERLGKEVNWQIFATDIDRLAIERARIGVFQPNIAAELSPERLGRFFTVENNSYRIRKSIRDRLIFAEQDLIKDPSFSRLDLISCRNLLIYLEPELQHKVLSLFHNALRPGGFLFLGNSESIGEFSKLFAVIDRKWKLYRRLEAFNTTSPNLELHTRAVHLAAPPTLALSGELKEKPINIRLLTEKLLLQDYAPTCVTVNEEGEILFVHGRTGKFLELASGEVSINVVRSAREGLRLELATALRNVVIHKQEVRCESLRVKTNGDEAIVNLTVKPVTDEAGRNPLILILFEEQPPAPAVKPASEDAGAGGDIRVESIKDQRLAQLEQELRIKTEYLQATVEELETTNEELKSANEELQATNEELQSTNEELETSQEELQSVNEELVTINTEFQQKIEDLSQVNNDMNNLLAGTGIGTIFVDRELRIQRFTPAVTEIINLIQTDIGRPVEHIVTNLVNYDQLVPDTLAVLNTLIPTEAEVQTIKGGWYLMRIIPYRTLENMIDGAVLTFVNITRQKHLQAELQQAHEKLQQTHENTKPGVA
jgi:two-component system CheB/CheR fusion protein